MSKTTHVLGALALSVLTAAAVTSAVFAYTGYNASIELARMLRSGLSDRSAQIMRTTWTDTVGLEHEIMTPRRIGEFEREQAARHEALVAEFSKEYKPKSKP